MNGRREDMQMSLAERIISAYDAVFRRTMTVRGPDVSSTDHLVAALEALDPAPRDLAETLILAVGPGRPVPQRFRGRIEVEGESLWRAALLLPGTPPSPGSTIDPRYYVADCRLNAALAGYRPLPELRGAPEFAPHAPPSDALWDAIVVASLLESTPAVLTRENRMRKDVERRVLGGLGEDGDRWALALALARATGLVREVAGRLYGRPESSPRLPILDPAALLEGEHLQQAAAVLLRLAEGQAWTDLDQLSRVLERRCPDVLVSDRDLPWRDREAVWLRQAAQALHRAGVFDAHLGPEGVRAYRNAGPRPERRPGIFLTPDREILVAPWELPWAEYGRLCRAAPYVDGDVVHRHRLTREGVAADIAAGHDNLVEWLGSRSRTGMPGFIRDTLLSWGASATRVTVLTGATVLEEGDRFTLLTGRIPVGARVISYEEPPPARFVVEDGMLLVPFGEDALTVRAVVSRLGERLPPSARAHRWTLTPRPVEEPDRLLMQLSRYSTSGDLPAAVEAAVHAAGGRTDCWVEEAVVLHLPPQAAAALRRDAEIGRLLGRDLGAGQTVVDRRVLPQVEARLQALGYRMVPPPAREGTP